MRVFLDMDGVLMDFNAGASRVMGRPNPYLEDPSCHGQHYIQHVWGMSKMEFWRQADNVEFWETMPMTPEAPGLMWMVYDYFGPEAPAILTTPTASPHCYWGKVLAVKRYFPDLSDKIIFAERKELLAHSGAVLIDDKESNIDGWNSAGGRGILFPSLGNSMHKDAPRALQIIREEFNKIGRKHYPGLSSRG